MARSASRLVRAWSGPGKLLALPQIYHFTDVANLPKILAAGELRCHRIARTVDDVGDASIKSRRGLINVTCGPRGKVWDYVPFDYAARSPMLYSIMCGNVPDVNPDQRRLVYLVSSTEALYEAGLACVFTDGNAATAFTRFREDPAELDHIVDWPLMRARYWFNTAEDPDRRRRRMAEFLVYQSLPLESVDGVVVYDRGAESDVAAVLRAAGSALPLAIRRAWYF